MRVASRDSHRCYPILSCCCLFGGSTLGPGLDTTVPNRYKLPSRKLGYGSVRTRKVQRLESHESALAEESVVSGFGLHEGQKREDVCGNDSAVSRAQVVLHSGRHVDMLFARYSTVLAVADSR